MAVVAYKCPNCGAPLEFSPESQKFECSFCGSSFSEEELQKYEPAQSSEQTIVQEPAEEEGKEETAVLYTCPSCGAQIVTTETTAATSCLYCHSPVVLEGRLQGEFHPDRVIPLHSPGKKQSAGSMSGWRKSAMYPRDTSTPAKLSTSWGFTTPTGCWTAIHRQTTQPMPIGSVSGGTAAMSTPKPLFTASIARAICILRI